MRKPSIGRVGRIFAAICALLFAGGAAAALLTERDWQAAAALGGLAVLAAYAALTGIDLYVPDERHRTGRLTIEKPEASDDAAIQ